MTNGVTGEKIIELVKNPASSLFGWKLEPAIVRYGVLRRFYTEYEEKYGGYNFNLQHYLYAEEIDEHYLLRHLEDTVAQYEINYVIGISDSLAEADNRLYNAAEKQAKELAKKFVCKIKDSTGNRK